MTPRPAIALTWIGHATVLIDIAGHRVLTDPVLASRVAHLRRRVPAPPVERVDTVLVSHVHMDHLHVPSLARIAPGARLVVPDGAGSLVAGVGAASVDTVRAGQQVTLHAATAHSPAVEVDVVPANHLAGRGPHSRVRAEPVGYVVRAGRRSVYFAGDTDLFAEMRDLGPLDVALLPIWGWGPTLGERHLDPTRAATATAWLDPRIVVPIHWGTFSPLRWRRGSPPWLNDPIDAFRTALRAVGLADRLVALAPGASLGLP